MQKNTRIPYQFGDPRDQLYFIFQIENLGVKLDRKLKTEYTNTILFDGSVRGRGEDKFLRADYDLSVGFSFSKESRNTKEFINKVLHSGIQKMFFVEYNEERAANEVNKILFTYAEATEGSPELSGTQQGEGEMRYNINFKFLSPLYYKPDEDSLSYLVTGQFQPIHDGAFDADGTITFGEYENNSLPNISNVTTQQINASLLHTRDRVLSFKDRFIRPVEFSTTTQSAETIILTNNNKLIVNAVNINSASTADNEVYLISFEPLEQGEYIEIRNATTNTNLKIEWLFGSPSSRNLIYNSLTNELKNDEGVLINYLWYSIASSDFLKFSGHEFSQLNQYKNLNFDILEIKKETNSNNTIVIQTLPSYL